jgi:prepilin-type N-terminal cleavage/methylation domain-containing protein
MIREGSSKSKGLTIIELVTVIVIVSILSAVTIAILRSRVDSAKWAEGRAMIGAIASAIRAYHAEKGPDAAAPTEIFGNGSTELGFKTTDLKGSYFGPTDFDFTIESMDPLVFKVWASNSKLKPKQFSLDNNGKWEQTGFINIKSQDGDL